MLCDVFSADQDHGSMLAEIPVLGTGFSTWEFAASVARQELADPEVGPRRSGKSVSAPETNDRIGSVQPTQSGRKIAWCIRLARIG